MKLTHETTTQMKKKRGFSLLEMIVVVAIMLVVAAVAVPNIVQAMRGVRLRGTANDFGGILQQARMRAVEDNRIYSVRFGNDGVTPVAYIDIYPQNQNGTSGQGQYTTQPLRDPLVVRGTGVNVSAMAAAPNVVCAGAGCLQNQVIPIGGGIALTDGSQQFTPATFNARGLPCTPTPAGVIPPTSCPTNPPVAFVTFFVSQPNPNVIAQWVAVTITPAGRVQTWTFDGNNWGRL